MPENPQAMRYWAVVPAAGIGSRFSGGRADLQSAKQYAKLGEQTVLERSVAALLANPAIAAVVVVLHADDTLAASLPVLRDHLPAESGGHPRVHCVTGGAERADSVLAGLRYLQTIASDEDFVLVHDAARPCLAAADLKALLDQLAMHPVGGLLAVPAVDTLKQVDGSEVCTTLDRSRIWQAQTPQMFRLGMLIRALLSARDSGTLITDESSAIEQLGFSPRIVAGSRSNLKITYPEDLALAGFYLGLQETQ